MLFRHCLFFIAIILLTFSVAIPNPPGGKRGSNANPYSHLNKSQFRGRQRQNAEAKKLKEPPSSDIIERMKKTKNLPEPGDEFHVGGQVYTGAHVMQAIINYFRCKRGYPRPYKNFAYNTTHPDASLHGKRPLPNPTGLKLWEFPLIRTEGGWKIDMAPGGARIVMSKEPDVFHGVIGHGEKWDGFHYPATHVQLSRKKEKA